MTDSEYVWLPDPSWTTDLSVIDGRCRYKGCQTSAVAAMARNARGTRKGWQWWRYCEEHVEGYRRQLRDGIVEYPVRVGSPAYNEALGSRP